MKPSKEREKELDKTIYDFSQKLQLLTPSLTEAANNLKEVASKLEESIDKPKPE